MKVALKGLWVQCSVPECECFDGSLRDLCEYCDDVSLMPVSQCDEADSLDSTVYGTGGCDLELAPREQQSECWSVFPEHEEERAGVSELAVPEHGCVTHVNVR